MRFISTMLGLVAAAGFAAQAPASDCPANVTGAALSAHAGAVVKACKQETEDGRTQFEVKITLKDGKRMELDVDPAGKILLTEEYVDIATVPAPVQAAFAAKYPGAKASRAEKQTAADGKVTYELGFGAGAAAKESTFAADGTLLEDESGQD